MKRRSPRWHLAALSLSYVVLIAAVALSGWGGVLHMRASAESYQPLDLNDALDRVQAAHLAADTSATTDTKQTGTRPLTNGVVLVVVAGLSADDVRGIPALHEIYEGGARATLVTSGLPTNPPGMGALLSGANQEITGGVLLDPQQAAAVVAGDPAAIAATQQSFASTATLEQVDTLFNAAHRSRSRTALFAPAVIPLAQLPSAPAPTCSDFTAADVADGATGKDIADADGSLSAQHPRRPDPRSLGRNRHVADDPRNISAPAPSTSMPRSSALTRSSAARTDDA